MSKPTLASLNVQLKASLAAFSELNTKHATLEYHHRDAVSELTDTKESLAKAKLDIEQLGGDLRVSRDDTAGVIARLRARLNFIRDLRDLRANYVNAIIVGAPAEAIEKLRIRFHASMVDLVTLDLNEWGVEAIMEQLSYHRPRMGNFPQEMACTVDHREPLLYPKQPANPYGV